MMLPAILPSMCWRKNDPGFTLQLPNEAFEYNSGLEQNEPKMMFKC